MLLVAARCINCGGVLEVNPTKDAAICPFCNTPLIVEKAIKQYNTTNNIQADVVNIIGSDSDFEIVAGVLKKYKGEAADVVIPKNVRVIGTHAFWGCGVKSVYIPETVEEIESAAFIDCTRLASVALPNSIERLPDLVFAGCKSLLHVSIPNSIEEIESQAFQHSGIEEVDIPDSVKIIGRRAFANCDSLTKVTLPKHKIQISVDTIDYAFGAFRNCPNLSIVINGDYAEYNGCFYGTPYQDKKTQAYRSSPEYRKKNGLCVYCGGTFKGIIALKCSVCGRRKDY